MAALREDSRRIIGAAVFAASLLTLYLASTLYHSTTPRARNAPGPA